MSAVQLAVDLGQGGCRTVVRSASGLSDVIETAGFWSGGTPLEIIVHAVRTALGTEAPSMLSIGVGMTGLNGGHGDARALLERLAIETDSIAVTIADDSMTAYLGALGVDSGGVVVAGTGSVALALGLPDRSARSDGWGAELGDRGSGYWIALRSVRAALRAYERGNGGPLVRVIEDTWGPCGSLPVVWRERRPSPDEIASIVPRLADVARAGDPIAADIWRSAGVALGESAADALGRAGLRDADAQVALTGGLTAASDLLATGFAEALAAAAPGARPVEAQGDPLAGALLLADSRHHPPAIEDHLSRAVDDRKHHR